MTWRKASRSNSSGGACVEAAAGRTVAVRDSKDPDGGQLRVSTRGWTSFARALKDGKL